MELWLRDESDAPESRTYGLNYHTGCMEQPGIGRLEERLNQMHTDEACTLLLLLHAQNAVGAEKERNWEAMFQYYTNFRELLEESAGSPSFQGRYANYLAVQAWVVIPLALYHQIKLRDYEFAVKLFGALRATRDSEMSERLPMLAYASIDQHVRIIDLETSYDLKSRGQEGLAQILADRAVRGFPPRWFLHPEIGARATLCHLLGNQHRKFGQYREAMKWRSELREWVDPPNNGLSLDAEAEVALSDAYLLCDMDDFSAASHKILKLKQRISDADLDTVHLRRVLHVDNAWLQCRRFLALQGLDRNASWDKLMWIEYEKAASAICSLTYEKSNGAEFIKFLQEVPKSVSCTDDFPDTLRMIEAMISVTAKASTNLGDSGTSDLYFDTRACQARIDNTLLGASFAHVHTRFNGLGFLPCSAYVPPYCQENPGTPLEDSGIQVQKLREAATLACIAESHNCWSLAYGQYRDVLESLVTRCELPPPDSYLRHSYQTLFIWAALPYALIYHTQLKDFEHSIWLLRTIQMVMEASVPGPWLGGYVRSFSKESYLAVELQMRMAAWDWSCALREDGMLDKAEALSDLATRNFPEEFQFRIGADPGGYSGLELAKLSLCRLLTDLYYDLGDLKETDTWEADLLHYTSSMHFKGESPTHVRTVAGRVIRINPDTPEYPRITHVPTIVKHANPPARSSGSSTPERVFNAYPDNNLISIC